MPLWRRRARSLVGLAVAAVAATLGGCSTFDLLNASSRLGVDDVMVARDVPYAPGPRHSLDVYFPKGASRGRPTLVFFYGGGWDSGSKADYAWAGRALAGQGYVTVVPDYGIYPKTVWPGFLRDSAEAVRWAHDHAGDYGGDPAKLVVMGHSAGAYNAVEMAVDRRWLTSVGLDPDRDILAVVGLSGPYDFLPLHSTELKTIFGSENQQRDAQPINHVDGRAAPMLLATGDRDTTVDPGNTDRMAARVRAAGGRVDVIHYPNLDHARTVGALARPLRWIAPVMHDVTAFITRQTTNAAKPD